MPLGKAAMNVGPEFFHHDRHRVPPDLCSPNAQRVAEVAIFAGMVRKGRDAGRNRTAHDFGIVELSVSRIAAGKEDAANRVFCSMGETAFAQLVEPWILS